MTLELAREPARGRRATKTAARRQAVIEAALECFTSRGYGQTSIADIQRASGASIGSIYHHFEDKAGIAVALYVEVLDSYQRSALRVLEEADGARAGVRSGVLHYLDWIGEHPREAAFLIDGPPSEAASRTASDLALVNARFFDALDAWLNAHAEAGRLRRLPRAITPAIWIGPSAEFARHWLSGQRWEAQLRSVREPLADAAWRALGPACLNQT